MDDIILALRTLLDASLTPDLYKAIYYGENFVPSKSEVPFVEVIPVETEMLQQGTNSMMNEYVITIQIKDIIKNFITANTDKEIISHVQTLVKRMEERDANGKPKSTTILGVLHDNRKITDTVNINNIGRINYTTESLNGSLILSAAVTITANRITLRS